MSKEPLNNDRIMRGALAILDTSGVSGLSMRRLGAALHVEAASLYHHIPNKTVLIQKIVDSISTRAVVPIEHSMPWTEVLLTFADRYRNVLRSNPGVVPLAATNHVSVEVSIILAQPLLQALEQTTASEQEKLFIIQSIAVFVIGHALAEVGNWPDPPTAEASYYDQWFETGKSALIYGFAKQYTAQ